MLIAYFDESGTHRTSDAVVVAGFIASEEAWTSLDIAWQCVLQGAGVSHFHAVDCYRGEREFAHLQRFERDKLRSDLVELICESAVYGIGSAVHRAAWESEATAEFRKHCEQPYVLCFNYCVQHMFSWSRRRAAGDSFALVFASQQEYEPLVARTLQQYQASRRWGLEFSSLSFAPAKRHAGLQAADLIARETYQYITSRIATKGGAYPEPPRDLARMIAAGIDFSGGSYDASALRVLIGNGPSLN